jgi:hypothetical protein
MAQDSMTHPAVRPFRIDVPEEELLDLRRPYPNLIYFNEVDKGNHFAAWQEPDLFTAEVRAAFRSLR